MAMVKRGSFNTSSNNNWGKEKQVAALNKPRKAMAVREIPEGAKPLYDIQTEKEGESNGL